MSVRIGFLAMLLALSATAGSIMVAPPAAAHDGSDIWAWYDCTWTTRERLNQAVVVRNDGSFPAPVQNPSGVTNSFRDRMVDASDRWTVNMQLNGISTTLRYFDGTGSLDILLEYRDLGANALGRTGWTFRSGSGCDLHGTSDADLLRSTVTVAFRSDWFTQDDSRRAGWEGCSLDSYSCSKHMDFGSLITHELGHAIGSAHSQDADGHNRNGSSSAEAQCSDSRLYATMCSGLVAHTSAKRTLHHYDIETLRRVFANN